MSYSGGQVNTNWMTLAYGGVTNPTVTTEQIPVLVDSTTTYSFAVTAAIDAINWASGFTLTLTFYNASGGSISSVTASSAALLTDIQQTVFTTPTVAPGGSSYCAATLKLNGSPASTNPLDVFYAAVETGSNTYIPDVVNYNYAFINGTWPWAPSNGAVINNVNVPLSGAGGNPDSLVIAGIIELMGGAGVPCAIPNLTDPATGNSAMFRISTPGGQLQTLSGGGAGPYDLGDFQPTQDFVESLLLDGERPFGTRSSNRTMNIPIAIYAPTQQTLNAARDYLLSVIDQQQFEVAWTPAATGLTTVYECFRALPSTIMYGFNNLREGAPGAPAIGLVTVSIQALPYGKSGIDGVVEIDFASGLVNGSGTVTPAVLDNFSGTVDTSDGWLKNTQYPIIGSNCAFHREPFPAKSPYAPLVYQESFSAISIVGLPVLAIWFGQSYDGQFAADPKFVSNVTFTATLYDALGRSIGCQATINKVAWNATSTKPTWTQISMTIPQRSTNFSYNSVVSYKLKMTNWTGGGQSGFVRMNAWLGYVSANPMSVTSATSPRGILYNMFGLAGSARAAVNAQVQLPNTDIVTQEFTQSGFFQVPAGVTNLQAESWGAGGAGSTVNSGVYGGGGGGGGEYAMEPSIVVTPGQKIPMTIGAGGIPALVTPTVQTFNTHGVTTSWIAPSYVDRALIETWGGGAAGAPGGGGGGAGGYEQALVDIVPGATYSMWVGNGGQPNTGTTSQALASRGGQNTWFGPNGTTSIAAAMVGAYGGSSAVAGSSTGGAGGKGFPNKYLGKGNPNYVATVTTGAVSSQVVSWNAGTQTINKGESALCLVSTLDQPSITVSDPINGNWTYIGGAFNTNATVNAFYLTNSKGTLGPSANTVTVTRSGSGVMVIGVIDIPWTSLEDITAARGLAFTNAAPQAVSATPLSDCNTYIAIFCGSTSHIASTPTGYTALTQLGSGPFLDVTYENIPTTAAQNPTTTYGSSQNWSSLMIPVAAGLAYQGGGGGRSPGGAGGGGGASGSLTGAGHAGGSSPKLGTSASGDYLTGGAGGTGPGGNGGLGANVPGAASAGTTPGGAGGGGYTKTTSSGGHTNAVNYQGAKGAPGEIRISYIPNNNVPVNGGNTIFGSSGTTSAIVTAHGGASSGWNSVFGGIGGTGSSNTNHYFGGRGAIPNRVNNNMMSAVAANVVNVASGTSTTANQLTLTAGVSLTTAYMENGVMLVVPVISSAQPQNPVATDTAGHSYYLTAQQALTDGTYLSVFVTALKFPIIATQVFTLATSNAISTAAYWSTITGVRDLEDTVIGTNAGNSGTQSVTRTYPDDTAVYFEYQVIANDAGSAALGGQSYPAASVAGGAVNGNLALGCVATMRNGSGTALTTSGSMGGSMPWATIALPFLCAGQTSQVLPVSPQATGFTGTTGTYTNGTGAANFNIDGGTGYMLVAVHGASSTTSTVAVTDSASNTYTLIESITAGSGKLYIFGAPVASDLTGAWTMTVTSSVSQGYDVNAFFVPGGTSADASGKGTNNATGTAVSLTYPGTTKANSVQFAAVGYGSATDTLTVPAWTNNILGLQLSTSVDAGRTLATDYFINTGVGFSGSAFTATLGSSLGWGAAMVSVVVPQWSGGGGSSAGAGGYGIDGSNGQSGGGPAYNSGGKGANGVLGNNGGLIGSIPGGGGSGGAISTTGISLGGPGGNGMIRVTHQPPLIAFNDWLLHRPGINAPADLVPLVPIPPADPPDNREYAIPSTVIGRNARFNGTYTVMLCAATWNTPANSRRISVTVNQYEYPGGPGVSVQATRTLTPATDIVNGYVSMGEVTLPIKQVADSNTDGYFTVSIHDTNQSDGFQDLMFLDTQGATCLVNIAPGTAGDSQYSNFYYDEPGLDTDLGKLLGSSHERDRAISVLDMAMPTGGPLYVTTGDNLLLVYSSKGAPNLRITYSPRWYSDRII
jgi:hypothetical protein